MYILRLTLIAKTSYIIINYISENKIKLIVSRRIEGNKLHGHLFLGLETLPISFISVSLYNKVKARIKS